MNSDSIHVILLLQRFLGLLDGAALAINESNNESISVAQFPYLGLALRGFGLGGETP